MAEILVSLSLGWICAGCDVFMVLPAGSNEMYLSEQVIEHYVSSEHQRIMLITRGRTRTADEVGFHFGDVQLYDLGRCSWTKPSTCTERPLRGRLSRGCRDSIPIHDDSDRVGSQQRQEPELR